MRQWCLAGALVAVAAARGDAQELAARVRCRGQRISDVQVRSLPPFTETRDRWWEGPIRWLNSIHSTTDPDVILRYLLLKPGDACSEQQRAESERILRAMPFIASASVTTVADSVGGVRLLVETRDELSAVVSVGARGASLTGFTFGSRNLGGEAVYGAVTWRAGEVRDVYGVRVSDYQFLGRRNFLDLELRRGDIGENTWKVFVSRPYLTDAQRVAWRLTGSSSAEIFPFFRGAELEPADVGLKRTYLDVGGIVRIGQPGRLSLFGVSFSRETDEAGEPPLPRRDSLVDYPALLASYSPRSNARINALWALRNVSYRRVERMDFLSAAQDIRLGFQLGTLLGRSLSVLGTTDDDLLLAADLYAGLGGGGTFLRLDSRWEGRQNYDTNRWDGIVGSGHLALYQRLGSSNTATVMLDYGGGWNQRIPFQLSLGDWRGGVRGYRGSREAGGQRLVARVEDRLFATDFRSRADVGVALFVDAGRLWAGDAPYGIDSPVRVGVGAGLLAAVPRGAKSNYRLDVAYALSDDGMGGRWEVRFSTVSPSRVEWREPRDLTRSRERATPESVF
ncbi:MAG TPA: hypothetical protein VFS05_04155 [Gemmatimonadaceae bacterium]|nr:hypothetical protein [Gemmatimonadaceae bacterium]